MATVISDIQVYPLKNPHPTIKANLSFVINEAFKVKATLIQGPSGLFVGFPGKFGDKIDEQTKKQPFYADIVCFNKETSKQLNEAVLAAYQSKTGRTELNQGTAPGPTDQRVNTPFN